MMGNQFLDIPSKQNEHMEIYTDAPQGLSYMDDTMLYGASRSRHHEHMKNLGMDATTMKITEQL